MVHFAGDGGERWSETTPLATNLIGGSKGGHQHPCLNPKQVVVEVKSHMHIHAHGVAIKDGARGSMKTLLWPTVIRLWATKNPCGCNVHVTVHVSCMCTHNALQCIVSTYFRHREIVFILYMGAKCGLKVLVAGVLYAP